MSDDDLQMEALSGLHRLLGDALVSLRASRDSRFYVVVVATTGPPKTHELPDMDAVTALIRDVLIAHEKEPESDLYVLVFQGAWWQAVKGPRKGLTCRGQFVPLLPLPVAERHIDPTGCMSDVFLCDDLPEPDRKT